MEYKIGDYITCLPGFQNTESYKDTYGGAGYKELKVFKVKNITSTSYRDGKNGKFIIWIDSFNGTGMYSNSIRKSTLEEIEQYIKENNTPIQEILEICKDRFPVGSKVIPVSNNGKDNHYTECILKGKFEIYENSYIGSTATLGFLYTQKANKFAKLVQESNTEEELPFKVGDKFTAGSKSPIYTIEVSESRGVYQVSWDDRGIRKVTDGYTKAEITKYFKERTWIFYIPQLKKEDFYNTKIDVSESEELSRLVQEKLFELGFRNYQSKSKEVKNRVLIYIHNDLDITGGNDKSYFQKYQYKQIYPQDLGININNKQIKTINNGKQEIKNSSSISKIQGLDKQISNSSRAGGIGLERTRSKISLGTINSPNKVGLSKC